MRCLLIPLALQGMSLEVGLPSCSMRLVLVTFLRRFRKMLNRVGWRANMSSLECHTERRMRNG